MYMPMLQMHGKPKKKLKAAKRALAIKKLFQVLRALAFRKQFLLNEILPKRRFRDTIIPVSLPARRSKLMLLKSADGASIIIGERGAKDDTFANSFGKV